MDERVILCRSAFGKWKNPKNDVCEVVEKFTWKTINRLEISAMTFGASLLTVKIPNRDGVAEDILLGFDNFEDYAKDGALLFGAVTGPVSGIIKNAEYCMRGRYHKLSRNFKKQHCINSGISEGFHKKNWIPHVEGTDVVLSHATDGSNGFPAIILTQILFSVSPTNRLMIRMTARSNKVTPIDLGFRFFFNLASHGAGEDELMEHLMKVESSKCYRKLNSGFFSKTPMVSDLYERKQLQHIIGKDESSIDCIYEVDKSDACIPLAMRVVHVDSGRMIEIHTNQAALELNTCSQLEQREEKKKSSTEHLTLEYLKSKLTDKEIEFFKCCVDCDKVQVKRPDDECPVINVDDEVKTPVQGKNGAKYYQNSGLSVLCHNFPNAINHQKKHPNILLKPGSVYENIVVMKFKVHVLEQPK
jgi:galactose mutarotase-like enzyme